MPSYGAIFTWFIASAVAEVHAQGRAGEHAQLRGSSGAGSNEVTVRVISKAPFPVTLANCESNRTLPAFNESVATIRVSKSYFHWLVPEGATWDCASGCSECFYLALGQDMGGGLVARIGYESHDGEDHGKDDGSHLNATNGSHSNEPLEPRGGITGIEFAATEAVNRTRIATVCRDEVCRPDWEQDYAVAWSTTIDLIVHGSVDAESKPSGIGQMMPLAFVRVPRGGCRGGCRGGKYRGGYRGGYYRPPVWRRPVWGSPVYPVGQCWVCSHYCYWLCR